MNASIPLRGSFRDASLIELFVHLHARRITASLDLVAPDGRQAHLVVREGLLSKIKVTPPVVYLGSVLYELGYIDTEQMNATLFELATAKRPHGELLLARGYIDDRKLQEALLQQTARKVHSLFSWDESTGYEIFEGLDRLPTYGGSDWPLADMRAFVWRGMRANPPHELVQKVMARAREHRFVLASAANLGRFGFDERELAAAECLRVKPMTVRELAAVGVVDRARTELLFTYLLLFSQLVPRASTAQARVQVGLQVPPAPSSPPRIPTPPPVVRESGFRQKRADSYRALEAAAEAKFKQAYVLYRRNDLTQAEVLCREALSARPEEPEYLALMIWLESQHADKQDAVSTQEAIRKLSNVVVMRDECESAHYYRGLLHKRLGNMPAAARDFHRVVQLNEHNVDAQRELRLYFMRARSSSIWKKVEAPRSKRGGEK
jgi:tetratricopeptide (TPR) repeat protein